MYDDTVGMNDDTEVKVDTELRVAGLLEPGDYYTHDEPKTVTFLLMTDGSVRWNA